MGRREGRGRRRGEARVWVGGRGGRRRGEARVWVGGRGGGGGEVKHVCG